MRKYSPILGLMIIVTAMMILQMGSHEVSGSGATPFFQCGQTGLGLGQLSGMPDLKTTDWSGKISVDKRNYNGTGAVMYADAAEGGYEEGGHGSEAGGEAGAGGFDRLWDVVSNG